MLYALMLYRDMGKKNEIKREEEGEKKKGEKKVKKRVSSEKENVLKKVKDQHRADGAFALLNKQEKKRASTDES